MGQVGLGKRFGIKGRTKKEVVFIWSLWHHALENRAFDTLKKFWVGVCCLFCFYCTKEEKKTTREKTTHIASNRGA
jgi:hypothetical protein